ncbi:MAG: outer membrane protein assembly factor BamA, partial [Gammaproteobacteria bacterium]|nr:outer membrane protein assembly factor BamA [Gammaproteobacteria bacterium]
EGYAFARVKVFPDINEDSKLVDITYLIEPGKKVYVRRINFAGNYKTRDEVLRRELRLMEGAELSNSKLERSKIRLQRLSFVEEVTIDKAPVAGTDDMVDININVTERLSGSFNIGAGFSQDQGFVFNLGLQMENLLGTGQKLGINFSNDDANKVYSVSFTDPYHTIDGVSRAFSFSYRKRDADEEDITNFLENTYGAAVSYGIPLTEYDRIQMGFGFERTEIIRGLASTSSQEVIDFINQYGDGATDENGDQLEASFDALTLTASYSHDTRNRTVFANQGSQQTVGVEMTAPGSDLEYYKLSYRTKFYFTLSSDLTLMLRSDIGYGDGYNDTEALPLFTRYYAGGLRTVRGFDSNSLGPRDILTDDPRGGDIRTVAGAEVIFPVPFVEKPPSSVRFSAFYDIGNVFLKDEAGGFDKDELRSAIGVSFVWLAPIGPLQFSWSRPIETQDGDETEGFQFSIGSFF